MREALQPLLGQHDPLPFELVNGAGRSPFLLTCEHAGRAVPAGIGQLGIAQADLDRHIAFDVGAEPLARALAAALDAPLVLQPYSRLVIDCNRPFEAEDLMPALSDGTTVPANLALDGAERHRRFEAIHAPFHREIARLLDDRPPGALIAVHSFTPCLATCSSLRPWHAGLLFRRDRRLADLLMHALATRAPHLSIAFNEPYSVDDLSDYTIPVHGERRGIAHVLLEVRSDGIADAAGVDLWAGLLSQALVAIEPAAVAAAGSRNGRR